ncbi:competence/damage-inducible protein A [Streptomyces sp. NPDC001514]
MTGTAAIVVIGDEVLNGSTTDTNSGWLCRQITGRGARVAQICTVHDDRQRIRTALSQAFALGPDLVITVGGLGPTRDDLTLSAIAEFAGAELTTHTTALRMVRRRYEELGLGHPKNPGAPAAADQARSKMALLPAGAEPIPNDVGVAPAVHLPRGNTGILALPGVPRELMHIVSHRSGEVFGRWLGSGHLRCATVVTDTNDEASLDPALRAFDADARSGVYMKSRARRFGQGVHMHVTVAVRGDDLTAVESALTDSLRTFREALRTWGIDVIAEIREEPPATGAGEPAEVIPAVPHQRSRDASASPSEPARGMIPRQRVRPTTY